MSVVLFYKSVCNFNKKCIRQKEKKIQKFNFKFSFSENSDHCQTQKKSLKNVIYGIHKNM